MKSPSFFLISALLINALPSDPPFFPTLTGYAEIREGNSVPGEETHMQAGNLKKSATSVTTLNASLRTPATKPPVSCYLYSSLFIGGQFPLKRRIRHHKWLRFFTQPPLAPKRLQKNAVCVTSCAAPGPMASFFQLHHSPQPGRLKKFALCVTCQTKWLRFFTLPLCHSQEGPWRTITW